MMELSLSNATVAVVGATGAIAGTTVAAVAPEISTPSFDHW